MPNSSPEPDFGPKTIISGGDPKRERLDNLVINIELTLTSIIQGVALYFLCDNSAQLLDTSSPGPADLCFECIAPDISFLVPLNWPHSDGHSLATRFQSQFLLFQCRHG